MQSFVPIHGAGQCDLPVTCRCDSHKAEGACTGSTTVVENAHSDTKPRNQVQTPNAPTTPHTRHVTRANTRTRGSQVTILNQARSCFVVCCCVVCCAKGYPLVVPSFSGRVYVHACKTCTAQHTQHTNERTNERTNARTTERTNERTNEQASEERCAEVCFIHTHHPHKRRKRAKRAEKDTTMPQWRVCSCVPSSFVRSFVRSFVWLVWCSRHSQQHSRHSHSGASSQQSSQSFVRSFVPSPQISLDQTKLFHFSISLSLSSFSALSLPTTIHHGNQGTMTT